MPHSFAPLTYGEIPFEKFQLRKDVKTYLLIIFVMYFLCKLPMRCGEAVGESESSLNAVKKNKKKQQKSMMMEN